jgi:excisionase family DNA binding protein
MTKLLRVWRVAEALDCSRSHVYTLIDTGRLRSKRLGPRAVRIYADSVALFLAERDEDSEDGQ